MRTKVAGTVTGEGRKKMVVYVRPGTGRAASPVGDRNQYLIPEQRHQGPATREGLGDSTLGVAGITRTMWLESLTATFTAIEFILEFVFWEMRWLSTCRV